MNGEPDNLFEMQQAVYQQPQQVHQAVHQTPRQAHQWIWADGT